MDYPAHTASAALRRANLTTHGYMLELGLANTGNQAITGWCAELTMPAGADLESAPGHEVVVVPVIPGVWTVAPARAGTLPPGTRQVLEIAVRCTRQAPLAVQFTAQTPSTKVFARVDVIAVRTEHQSVATDASAWPGSTTMDRGQTGHLQTACSAGDQSGRLPADAELRTLLDGLEARVGKLERSMS